MCSDCLQPTCPPGCPGYIEPDAPICPICLNEADMYYMQDGEIVGCEECVEKVNAWDD